MTETISKFGLLLNDSNSSLPLILSFLDANDQENLLSSCKDLLYCHRSIQLFANSIHYCRYLRFDHSLNLMWGYDQEESFMQRDASVRTMLTLQQLSFEQVNEKTVCATKALQVELSKLITCDEAALIATDVIETLREGPLLLPTLRREHVGMHSNSPIQYHYCDVLTQEEWLEPEEPIYATLRQSVFAHQQEFSETARTLKTSLKRMRVLAEETARYNQSPCVLSNLVNVLLTLCDSHIESVALYLKSIPSACERMVYFISYYINFRKTVIALHEKLGFLFSEFQYMFEELFPEWNILPTFSIVTILLKKWLRRMEGFHCEFNQVFSLLLLKERETRLVSMLEDTTDLLAKAVFNEEFKAKTASFVSFSTLVESNLRLKADEYMKILNQSPIALNYLTHQYRQYLVDLSINQVNVHLNNHSKQNLGAVYYEASKTVLQDTEKYYRHLWSSLGNLAEVRLLIDADVMISKDLLKPTTMRYLVELANYCLQSMKEQQKVPEDQLKAKLLETILSEWKDISLGNHKQDALIESMLGNLRISTKLPEETEHLYDISKRANLDKLEELLDSTESVCDINELEGYNSEEEVDSELLQGIPAERPGQMEVEDELLKISSSVESTKQGDSMGLDSDYELGKRPRDYDIDLDLGTQQFKRAKLAQL